MAVAQTRVFMSSLRACWFSLTLTLDTFYFPFAFPLRLRLLVPTVSCLVSVRSAVSTLTLEVRGFLCGVFHRNPCLCYFLFLFCHLSCPCRVFLSPSSLSRTKGRPIGSSSCVFAFDVVVKMLLLLRKSPVATRRPSRFPSFPTFS